MGLNSLSPKNYDAAKLWLSLAELRLGFWEREPLSDAPSFSKMLRRKKDLWLCHWRFYRPFRRVLFGANGCLKGVPFVELAPFWSCGWGVLGLPLDICELLSQAQLQCFELQLIPDSVQLPKGSEFTTLAC